MFSSSFISVLMPISLDRVVYFLFTWLSSRHCFFKKRSYFLCVVRNKFHGFSFYNHFNFFYCHVQICKSLVLIWKTSIGANC